MLRTISIWILGFAAGFASGSPEVPSTDQSESFTFVAFGDRTGGPSTGVEILESAVEMTNWLDPDLVMTVGDLVEGQCLPKQWIEQAGEFRGIMDALSMPWFAVAGNHDVYPMKGRGDDNVGLYRDHFGELTYSFDHKFAHFIVLFSDEALGYHNPRTEQNMSQAQMDWLRDDLAKSDAKQVFVFLHHPRWTKRYSGCNWDEVHSIFAADGRSTTVVGGHVHALRDDGMRDNVHYLTLATTGGWPKKGLDHATLHHITQFQVRSDSVSIVHIPIGSVLPGDAFAGEEIDEIYRLGRGEWVSIEGLISRDGISPIHVQINNPTARVIEYKVAMHIPNDWDVLPEISSFTLEPGGQKSIELVVTTPQGSRSPSVLPEVIVRAYYPHKHGKIQPISIKQSVSIED